ncbi:ATP-binding protein [Nonomuraea sp. SYSU D8015]|uniref:ATP-binding protein n=1 Tax=Nonomuraea sp. SYSU D8015 TaxID=2593644 RepID=UPI001CB72B4F|nr:ATP-binding protein [Nonomuraea sp. SYSU D8015]
MSADAPQRRLSPKELTVLAFLGTTIVMIGVWLWAVSVSPSGARVPMALAGGGSALLLSCAVATIVHLVAAARVLRERAAQSDARLARLEREVLWTAEKSVPAMARRLRSGAPAANAQNLRPGPPQTAVSALAGVPQPTDGALRHLLAAAGQELAALERDRAAAQAAHAAAEAAHAATVAEISRVATEILPELVKRIETERVPAETALDGIRLPELGRLHDLLTDTARHLGDGERKAAAVMAACAGAAARVQAQATSLLARLRELEEQYGDHEEIFADLLDLDHRVSQMSRLADNIALLSGGRSGRRWTRPIVMESILRGAMGRINAFRRIRPHSTSTSAVVGYAAEGVMHALAELMDNATTFSAHGTEVHVYVDEEDAGIVITIEDSGLGMRPRERHHATRLVTEPLDLRTLSGTRLGLAVVGRLVDKYGLTVSFRPSARGGTGVVVLIPRQLITQPRPAADLPPPALPAAPENETAPEESGDLLPRRRRGQTLAEAMKTQQRPPAARPARSGQDAAARLAAFRQAGGRGRTSAPAPGDS